MTSPDEIEPTDADAVRRQDLTPSSMDAPRTQTTSGGTRGDKPAFDVDEPSPEVVPVYLRGWAAKAAAKAAGAVQARSVAPATESSSPVKLTPSPREEAAPAAAATDPLASDADALADAICRDLADALYKSMRAIVVAAIRSAQKAPAERDAARSADVVEADASAPAREGPVAGSQRAGAPTHAPIMGRTQPFAFPAAGAEARQRPRRHGAGPSGLSR